MGTNISLKRKKETEELTKKTGFATIALVSALVLVLFAVSVAPAMADPLPPTPYVINGYVFYANGTECNGPIVEVTNMNTSNTWPAENDTNTNYYELVLANGTDVNESEVLQFDAKDPAGTQFATTEHTITQDEMDNGGLFNFNITLKIPASVTYDQKKVKLNSNGMLKAFITLPEPYDVAMIDIDTVRCENASVIGSKITGKGVLEAKFKIPKLEDVKPGPEVELTVVGRLYDGTPFEGSNTVEVV